MLYDSTVDIIYSSNSSPAVVSVFFFRSIYIYISSTDPSQETKHVLLLLPGTIVNRTYGAHKNLPGIYLHMFTNTSWYYVLWSPVMQ